MPLCALFLEAGVPDEPRLSPESRGQVPTGLGLCIRSLAAAVASAAPRVVAGVVPEVPEGVV